MNLGFDNDYDTSENSNQSYKAGIYKAKVSGVALKEGAKGEYLCFDFTCWDEAGNDFELEYINMFPESPKMSIQYRNFCLAFGIGNNIKSLDDFNKGSGYICLSPRIQTFGKWAGKAFLKPIDRHAYFSKDKKHASEIKDNLPAEIWKESLKYAEESAEYTKEVEAKTEETETETDMPF